VGVIRSITTVKEKLQDRGQACIFVGYAAQHAGNVYRMMNLKTGRLCLSRDVRWLHKSYGEYSGLDIREDAISVESPLGNGEEEGVSKADNDISKMEETTTKPTEMEEELEPEDGWHIVNAGRETIHYEARPTGQTRWGTSYKSNIAAIANTYSVLYESDDEADGDKNDDGVDGNDIICEPKTFEEAWNHPDAINKKGWREAIKKEFSDMKSRKVWQKVKKNIIPHKRLIGNKWVFKKKKDGRYRARLCA
jgi:hypothetical protein